MTDAPANIIVPRELLLSWAAGLVRAVCAPTPDEIAEPVRETARQITVLVDRATARARESEGNFAKSEGNIAVDGSGSHRDGAAEGGTVGTQRKMGAQKGAHRGE